MLPQYETRRKLDARDYEELGLFDEYLYVGRCRLNPCHVSQAIIGGSLLLFMARALGAI